MSKGCLIIHGLTGTPATVSTLKDALIAADYRVAAPCLAGHGGRLRDLARTSWEDWYRTVRVSYQALRREVDNIYCAGISLGALLGLKLAIDEGWGVRAMVLLSTPLKLALFERVAAPLVRYTPLRWFIRSIPKDFNKSVADPEGRLLYEDFSLTRIPANAVFELMDLQREVEKNMKNVTVPVMLLHGAGDRVAPVFNVQLVKGLVASDIVEEKFFPKSRHVITMDLEKADVASSVVDFFGRFA